MAPGTSTSEQDLEGLLGRYDEDYLLDQWENSTSDSFQDWKDRINAVTSLATGHILTQRGKISDGAVGVITPSVTSTADALVVENLIKNCLLYTSDAADERSSV